MKIKNEEELANVMGMKLAEYANRVSRGEIRAFKGFLEGQESVTVNVSFGINGLIVEAPLPQAVEPIQRDFLAESDEIIAETFAPGQEKVKFDFEVPMGSELEVKPKRKRKNAESTDNPTE